MKAEAEATKCFDCNTNYIDNSALNIHLAIEHNHANSVNLKRKIKAERNADELIDKKPRVSEENVSLKNEHFDNCSGNSTPIEEINEPNHFDIEHNLDVESLQLFHNVLNFKCKIDNNLQRVVLHKIYG